MQSDFQEQLGLSALLKGTSTDVSPSRLWDTNQRPLGYCYRLPASHYRIHFLFDTDSKIISRAHQIPRLTNKW
jgi:hypothetical protein